MKSFGEIRVSINSNNKPAFYFEFFERYLFALSFGSTFNAFEKIQSFSRSVIVKLTV